jgi:hypothetical protein
MIIATDLNSGIRTEVQLLHGNDGQDAHNRVTENLYKLTRAHYDQQYSMALQNQEREYQTAVAPIHSRYQEQLAQHEKKIADTMLNYGKQCVEHQEKIALLKLDYEQRALHQKEVQLIKEKYEEQCRKHQEQESLIKLNHQQLLAEHDKKIAEDSHRAMEEREDYLQRLDEYEAECRVFDQKQMAFERKKQIFRNFGMAFLCATILGASIAGYQVARDEKLRTERPRLRDKLLYVLKTSAQAGARGGVSSALCGAFVSVCKNRNASYVLPMIGAGCNTLFDVGMDYHSEGKVSGIRSFKSFTKNSVVGLTTEAITDLLGSSVSRPIRIASSLACNLGISFALNSLFS